MTLESLRALRDTDSLRPILLMLNDGRELLLSSARHLGITPTGVVLAVAETETLFLAPEQIREARTIAAPAT